jgi:archaeosine-15-forming tRNA-guanine transglycosylase
MKLEEVPNVRFLVDHDAGRRLREGFSVFAQHCTTA